jgi:pimeloyl-ACP methyl ester carboxylesterase
MKINSSIICCTSFLLTVCTFISCNNTFKNIAQPIYPDTINKEEIELTHPDSTILYGLIETPSAQTSLPIIIFIAGSGPTDHNGNSGVQLTSNAYKLLADEFHQNGLATLRYDKRTATKSKIHPDFKPSSMSFEKLVEDVILFIDLAIEDKRFSDIILIGHSQGSLLAILAAQQRKINKLISLAGAGRSIDLILFDQFRAMGLSDVQLVEFEHALKTLKNGELPTQYPLATMSLFQESSMKFLSTWMGYDPSQQIKKLNIPVLVANGTTDIQVPVKEAEILHKAYPKSKFVIIDGMNHILKESPIDRGLNIKTYNDPALPLSKGLVAPILDFIKSNE